MSTATMNALPAEISGHKAPGWWGMILLITTEATLFAALIASYFYLRSGASHWPLGGIAPPPLLKPIIMTILLVGSSVPMIWADLSSRRNNQNAMKLGLGIAWIMGAAFLVLQYTELSNEPFSWRTNAYGSLFFTITGLHGAHVLGALLLNGYTILRSWLGHIRPGRTLVVANTALYWHFVDAVWLVIFTSLYLSPRFLPS